MSTDVEKLRRLCGLLEDLGAHGHSNNLFYAIDEIARHRAQNVAHIPDDLRAVFESWEKAGPGTRIYIEHNYAPVAFRAVCDLLAQQKKA